jgi:Anti-sigma-K factor rskA
MQTVSNQPRKRSWGLRFSLAFATAAVIFALAAYLLWKQDRQHQQLLENLQSQLIAAQNQAAQEAATLQAVTQVVAAPDTTQIALLQQSGGPPGQAHVLYNARLGTVVYSGQIAPPPADRSYQLWLVPASGAAVSAGVVAPNQPNGVLVAHLQPGLAAKAFAVTVEPQTGSPQPTGAKVLVGTLNG